MAMFMLIVVDKFRSSNQTKVTSDQSLAAKCACDAIEAHRMSVIVVFLNIRF